jgi:hypothetical protein
VIGRAINWDSSGEQVATGVRYNYVTLRFLLLGIAIGLVSAGSISADDNVREVQGVQEKLRDGGFYSGQIDGAYSSQLAEALTRYQTDNKLPVTGQLDVDTSSALDVKPAIIKNRAAPERSSENSRQRRSGEHKTSTEARKTSSPGTEETESSTETQQRTAPEATAASASETGNTTAASARSATEAAENVQPASAPPAAGQNSQRTTETASAAPPAVSSSSDDGDISTERLRQYVGAFVHAGLDPQVGPEADFFADRVKYYDQGVIDREQIRNDLQNHAAHWPERHFWFAGNIRIEPQHRKRVRVTFPLRYELRNGATYSSGTINKTLVLEPAGENLQILAVSESKSE